MAATSKARRRTTPINLAAALVAYAFTRESVRDIEDRLHVCDMTLYREIDRRGIKRRRPPHAERFCAFSGCEALLNPRQQKYCCPEHQREAQRLYWRAA